MSRCRNGLPHVIVREIFLYASDSANREMVVYYVEYVNKFIKDTGKLYTASLLPMKYFKQLCSSLKRPDVITILLCYFIAPFNIKKYTMKKIEWIKEKYKPTQSDMDGTYISNPEEYNYNIMLNGKTKNIRWLFDRFKYANNINNLKGILIILLKVNNQLKRLKLLHKYFPITSSDIDEMNHEEQCGLRNCFSSKEGECSRFIQISAGIKSPSYTVFFK